MRPQLQPLGPQWVRGSESSHGTILGYAV
jgi:hypothetical protein